MASDALFGVETRVFKAKFTGTLEQLGAVLEAVRKLGEGGAKVEILEWHVAKKPREAKAAKDAAKP
jgi:hypothetical protein